MAHGHGRKAAARLSSVGAAWWAPVFGPYSADQSATGVIGVGQFGRWLGGRRH